MSIAQRNEIEDLKRRLAALEEQFKPFVGLSWEQLLTGVKPSKPVRETLTLEKRKSA